MGHREIQHVTPDGGSSGRVLHIGCMETAFVPDDDIPEDPFQPEQDLEDLWDHFPGGGGTGGPGSPDVPTGDVIDLNPPPPNGVDIPTVDVIDLNPPPVTPPDVPSGDVIDLPDPGDPPPGDPTIPPEGGDIGGEPPIYGPVLTVQFSFRRTGDPDEYYTGTGTVEDPYLLPVGATGDTVRARTVLWVDALFADVGQASPTYVDLP